MIGRIRPARGHIRYGPRMRVLLGHLRVLHLERRVATALGPVSFSDDGRLGVVSSSTSIVPSSMGSMRLWRSQFAQESSGAGDRKLEGLAATQCSLINTHPSAISAGGPRDLKGLPPGVVGGRGLATVAWLFGLLQEAIYAESRAAFAPCFAVFAGHAMRCLSLDAEGHRHDVSEQGRMGSVREQGGVDGKGRRFIETY